MGRVLDRNGVVLVDNRISVVVTVDRTKLPSANKPPEAQLADRYLLDRLATEITHYTFKTSRPRFLEKRLADVRYSPYTPVPVAEDVPEGP